MVVKGTRPVIDAPRNLSPLFKPKSIAIVGASERNIHSRTVVENLKESFRGSVYPINPGRDEVAGLKCYPSVGDLPEVPDLAMVLVGRDSVVSVIRDCGNMGVAAAIINADGFAESTLPDGRELQLEVVRVARQGGVLVLGPNGLGLEDLLNGTLVFAAPISEPIKHGSLAVISQSGGNCCAFAESAIDRDLGLSHLVSTGNEADVSLSEVVDYLVDDPGVTSFCLYIEAIRDPNGFLRAVERARDAGKPVIAIKVGKSELGRQAAMAHTGAITGSEVAVDALFARAGVERASTIDEALDLASVVAQVPRDLWPRGPRTVVFTMGGGAASIIADEAEGTSLQLSPLSEALKVDLSKGIPDGITVKNPIYVPGVHFGPNPT
ncbi:MAG: CoA-binding protein, partial [Minisyncoccia bacterium]